MSTPLDDALKQSLVETADALSQGSQRTGEVRAAIGFDGFVDDIIDVVDTRKDAENYQRIESMNAFGRRISDAAGLSTNIELVSTQQKLGGNGPIMSNALSGFGLDITYIGCLGLPSLHPVFEELAEKCREVISVADPGLTWACEFNDGKVMLGRHESLREVRWERIVAEVGLDRLRQIVADAHLVAALNWTMLPYLTEVWEGMLREVFAELPAREDPPIAFFDLCDPEKREDEELRKALDVIKKFEAYTLPVLGLNRKEATEVADALGLNLSPSNDRADLLEITQALGEELGLHGLVVHPTSEAAVYTNGRTIRVPGPYTSRPLLTTGAGDNFNAGFCLAQVLGLDPQASLIAGVGTSGFYVRNRRSPSISELADFLREWSKHGHEEF